MSETETESPAEPDAPEDEAPEEEEVPEYTTTDQFVVWDSKGVAVLAGPFVEEEEADAAKVELLSKSHQWEDEHLTVQTLPVG